MALIVTCKDPPSAVDALARITRAIENHKVPCWGRTKSNLIRNTTAEFENKTGFRPSIVENRLYFGLADPDHPPYSVTRELYERYHSLFYSVLVHFSWLYYFTVEQSPDRLEGIDARIAE
jgi:hypothetical protein